MQGSRAGRGPDARQWFFPFIRQVLILLAAVTAICASATVAHAVPSVSPACADLDGATGTAVAGATNPLWIGNKEFWPGDVLLVTLDLGFPGLALFGPNWSGGVDGISASTPDLSPLKYRAEFSAYRDTALSVDVDPRSDYTIACTSNPPPAPAITSLSPNSGSTAGGLSITITGTGFTGVSGVKFGSTSATITAKTATSITATLPAHAAGAIDVSVTTPVGTGTLDDGFTYIAPGKLEVTGPASFSSTGPHGGPFTPASATWTLKNTGGADIDVTVSESGDDFFSILSIPGTPVTLAPNDTVDVTLTLDAGSAPVATLANTLSFTNATNGAGDTTRPIQLDITKAATTTSLAASADPVVPGTDVTFTATVAGSGTLTGAVEFAVDGSVVDTVPLSGGTASTTVTAAKAGTHGITATYAGDTNHTGSTGTFTQQVDKSATAVALTSSVNPATIGDSVTFTATLDRAAAGGSVEFRIDGILVDTVPVTSGVATYTTSSLASGAHAVTATYGGDANHAASSGSLTQQIDALGQVTLAVNVIGGDAVFGFSSTTAALSIAVTTSGGSGRSPAITLPAGSYTVTVDDMSGMGYALMDVACTDSDSSGDSASRTASITLAVNEAVTCTFALVNAHEATSDLIEDFLETSGRLLLGNLPDAGRRIERLNGSAGSGGGDLVGGALNYVSGIVASGSADVSASLSAIDALTGNSEPSAFDAWLEGSFALFDGTAGTGRFGRVALGADYLVTPDLLVGGFVQIDGLTQDAAAGPATASGTGWLAGPYVTARLGSNLYLDLLAGAGRSSNQISPLGTYTDGFDATRWLLSAALEGEWSAGKWSFVPRARLGFVSERSDTYTDSLGVDIPAVVTGSGEVSIGPGVRYSDTLGDGTMFQFALRFDAAAEFAGAGPTNPHGRVEAGIGLGLPGGAQLDLTAALDGIGSATQRAVSGRVSLSAPLN